MESSITFDQARAMFIHGLYETLEIIEHHRDFNPVELFKGNLTISLFNGNTLSYDVEKTLWETYVPPNKNKD